MILFYSFTHHDDTFPVIVADLLAEETGQYDDSLEADNTEPESGGQLARLGSGEYLCLVCGKKLSNAHNGKRHVIQSHQTNMKLQCTICKKEYKNRGTLDTHYYQTHGVTPAMVRDAITVPIQSQQTDMKAQCIICKREYKNRRTLDTHYNQTHGVSRSRNSTASLPP